jgi:hypothetical protein
VEQLKHAINAVAEATGFFIPPSGTLPVPDSKQEFLNSLWELGTEEE